MSDDIFVNRIRGLYFTAMTQLPLYSFYQFLDYVSSQVHGSLASKYTAIFQKSLKSNRYELVAEHFQEGYKSLLKETTSQLTLSVNGEETMSSTLELPDHSTLKIPIYNNYQLKYYLVVIAEKNSLSPKKVRVLFEETEKFFVTVHNLLDSRIEKEKSDFLTQLSSLVFATPDLSHILKTVIARLESFYTSFQYRILLSQDYEVDQDLPIQLIRYNDETVARPSTQALMTGRFQIEDQPETNHSCLYFPLNGKQGVYGVLEILVPRVLLIPEQEVTFFRDVSKVVGQAIENASLYQTSDHLVQDLKLINKVSHQLNSNLNIAEIIPLVKDQLMSIFKPDEIAFVYCDPEQETGEGDYAFKVASKSSEYFKTRKGHEFIHHLIPYIRYESGPIFSGDYTKNYPQLDYHSLVAFPMIHGEILQGFIAILHRDKSAFSFRKFRLAESIVQHSALAQANAILNEQLERAVITDYLTKLYSRNYLDEMIHMHMKLDEMGSLILFDIDDFKNINDTYGHHIGDQVIIQVGDILMNAALKDSIPTRWGGEELALYLPNYNTEEAIAVAENIRKQVKELTDPNVTLSSGVASWRKGEALSVNDLFIRSDRALYEAKNRGKNQVIVDLHSY